MVDRSRSQLVSDLERRRRPAWESPYHWWGPPGRSGHGYTVDQLVQVGVLTAAMGRHLVHLVRSGESLVVTAGPAGVGKSTLAAALVAELPLSRRRFYIRGMAEPFDFLDEVEPESGVLLVNELSPHLPIYAWDDVARQVLQLGCERYQVIATAHAANLCDLVRQLTEPPVSAAPAEIAALGHVVVLGTNDTGRYGAVQGLWRLADTGNGEGVVTAAEIP